MVKGYTSQADVENFLGVASLASIPLAELTTLLGTVESYIDRRTRRSWLTPAITAERYTLLESTIYLRQRPVTSVQLIQVRSAQVGDTLITLSAAGNEYELFDANLGQVNIQKGYQDGQGKMVAFVSYTPNQPLPADISRAALLIVAHSMVFSLYPDRFGASMVKMGDLSLKYIVDGGMTLACPQLADDILDGYTLPMISHSGL